MERMSLETRRNLFHLVLGIVIVSLIHYRLINVWAILTVTLTGFLIAIASRRRPVPVIEWFLRHFERDEDMESIPGRGALFIFVGFLLALSLFPLNIALASIIILSVGDSVSSIVGSNLGKVRHPLSNEKFLEGNITGFLFAFLGAMFFVSIPEAFMASLVAMVIEAVDVVKGRRIEDNITIPLAAGFVITLLRML